LGLWFWTLAFELIFFVIEQHYQQDPDQRPMNNMPSHPSIGLALSGGAARGLAHRSVASLEENKIPINYIAGTSAGSIVGGAFCSRDANR
jgi:NTE family protein